MALINCPECGREVSDKAQNCIHCGYPLRTTPYARENIMGKDYDVSFLLDKSMSQAVKIKELKELTGCDLFKAKEIVLKYHPTEPKKEVITCPKCGSTAITTGARGINKTWGLIGADKTVNRCAKCGHMWKPQ